MKISAVTEFVFSILIVDLLFYGILYDIKKHGLVPSHLMTRYQDFMGLFMSTAIILAILFALALIKDIVLEDRLEI
ncbi:MAG: hypothetical protein M1402_02960 [Candidatus Thermoplasmatota archaeon]|nr:hypothetical protein [Candidatus Thermoplasmatota archaeon]MCL5665342.1 hypothetical protein [Candidatus Thermoplasmatota archaeon]